MYIGWFFLGLGVFALLIFVLVVVVGVAMNLVERWFD